MVNLRSALAVLAVLAILVAGWQGYRFGENAEKARNAAEVLRITEENQKKQKELVKSIDKVADNAEKEKQAVEEQLVDADAAVERLRESLRIANSRANTSTTCIADANAARTQLADCAGKYRDMAKRADQLRALVIGLQGYARSVSE